MNRRPLAPFILPPSSFNLRFQAWLTAGQRFKGPKVQDRLRMAAGDAVRHRPVRGLQARPGVDGRPGWSRPAPWRTRLILRTKQPSHTNSLFAISDDKRRV